jgi:hypothetical protein
VCTVEQSKSWAWPVGHYLGLCFGRSSGEVVLLTWGSRVVRIRVPLLPGRWSSCGGTAVPFLGVSFLRPSS